MGTEILRPQDCLMRVQSSTASIVIPRSRKPSSNSYYYSSNPNPKFYRKTEQRKQHPQPQPQQQQQYHIYSSQSETSVVKNGVRSSSSSSPKLTPSSSPATTGKPVVKSDIITASVTTILKRGESLDNINSKKKAEKLKIKRSISGDLSSGFSSSSSSSGSESSSDSERGVVRSEVYAGNAFYLSPAPSSLPLPTFFSIKKEGGSAIIDDSATKDLRRLLRLD